MIRNKKKINRSWQKFSITGESFISPPTSSLSSFDSPLDWDTCEANSLFCIALLQSHLASSRSLPANPPSGSLTEPTARLRLPQPASHWNIPPCHPCVMAFLSSWKMKPRLRGYATWSQLVKDPTQLATPRLPRPRSPPRMSRQDGCRPTQFAVSEGAICTNMCSIIWPASHSKAISERSEIINSFKYSLFLSN